VDGILETVPVPSDMRHLHSAVVSRLKIMAGLNIAERRLPHDGRIAMKTGGEDYDLRVSIVPTKYGESVSLRILGRHNLFLDLTQLCMEHHQTTQPGSGFRHSYRTAARHVAAYRPDRQRQNHHALHRTRSRQ
jgi:type II secretory ATPase GspE/PulE/Tfp pilus assembly ATPase PilB-like protein